MDDFLIHYGTPHEGMIPHSGRYEYGSGEDPYQGRIDFLGRVKQMRASGEYSSDTEIARAMGMSSDQFRARLSSERARKQQADIAMVQKLKDKGMSNVAIAERLGMTEGTVRNYLKYREARKATTISNVKQILKENIDTNGIIDVGVGTELYLGVSREKMKAALQELRDEGYKVYYNKVKQLGTGEETTLMGICPPGMGYSEFKKRLENDEWYVISDRSEDGGKTFTKIESPRSVDSSRVQICYSEDGGSDKDGIIELRRGVDDLSLGRARYAQVRIAVDGTHYLKGMAMYRDDMPEGVDIIFNTSKHKGTPMMSDDPDASQVLKVMKNDPENPFGASIKKDNELFLAQRHYIDKNGKEQLSALNYVYEEGNWDTWSKTLSSQFLSKQSTVLAKQQLDLEYSFKKQEYDEIMSLTNPTVKRKLLLEFADGCDSDAVHLKAAGLPRQGSYVLLATPGLKPGEIYAPNYKDGEMVALIRYPHGGPFEIPELKVNNRSSGAKALMPKNGERSLIDAVGVHPETLHMLSGADSDGDTALVIPTATAKIATSNSRYGKEKAFEQLRNFEPKEAYPYYDGMKVMKQSAKGKYMGDITNLISDMQTQNATPEEVVRAMKHSMVVIDAPKHKLDFRRSYEENGIAELKEKYQGGARKGASTLITKASGVKYVNEREEGKYITDPNTGKKKKIYIDPDSGEKLYTETGRMRVEAIKDPTTNKIIGYKQTNKPALTKTTQMADTKDARELSSGTRMEEVYAQHANKLKALANKARKAYLDTPPLKYEPSAKRVYKNEVASLVADLNLALKNAPLERKAQLVANNKVRTIMDSNPDMDNDSKKKLKGRALTRAREEVGAGKKRIKLTPERVKVINSGAISDSMLGKILNNMDSREIKEAFTPRTQKVMTTGKISLCNNLSHLGYTASEIADRLGVSVSTVNRYLK